MVWRERSGITASHFLLDFLGERGQLPGFVDGYSRIAADEQRHIAYGTQFLQQAVREDPRMAEVIRARLFDLLPTVAESVSPPSEGAWTSSASRTARSPRRPRGAHAPPQGDRRRAPPQNIRVGRIDRWQTSRAYPAAMRSMPNLVLCGAIDIGSNTTRLFFV